MRKRKPDRFAGRNLKDRLQRGEWAEMYFMMQVAGLGLKVSRPYSTSSRYDVGVESGRRVLRVQVKSTIYSRDGYYTVNVHGAHGKEYKFGTVDFFAVLIIPLDDWYIIPYDVIGGMTTSLSITTNCKQAKYEEFREAWDLFLETGLTIQACCDDLINSHLHLRP